MPSLTGADKRGRETAPTGRDAHLIVTVTLNPALDITYSADRFMWGESNRVALVHARAGGKGINVARVLQQMGQAVIATGLAGGTTGTAIRDDLRTSGIREHLLLIAGESRRTITAFSVGDAEATEFIEPGPAVGPEEWSRLLTSFRELAPTARVAVFAGSLPPGVPGDAYAQLCSIAATAGVPTLLDTSGPALLVGLAGHPTVVKPNLREVFAAVAELEGEVPSDLAAVGSAGNTELEDVLRAAARLRSGGAVSVVVSMGFGGLLAITPEGTWRAVPPKVSGNPVGAGDAAVAALAAGMANGRPWEERLARAAAVSAAAVRYPVAGGYHPDDYRELLRGTTVTPWRRSSW